MAKSNSGPGDSGSMQGPIKTPMCDKNVSNKGGGATESYSKITGAFKTGKSSGAIYGPGTKGALKK